MGTTPLRVYAPGESDDQPNLSWTLTQFYSRYLVPRVREYRESRKGTLEIDSAALNHWTAITGDPPIGSVTEETLDLFTEKLRRSPGLLPGTSMSPNTVRKHLRHLQWMLNMTGRKDPKHRRAVELTDRVPMFEPPKERESEIRTLTMAEMKAVFDACDKMPHSAAIDDGVSAGDFWRAIITLAWNTGGRIGTLMGARWDHFRKDDPTRGYSGQWATVPPQYNKRGVTVDIYLNTPALAAIRPFRRSCDSPLIPWRATFSYLQHQRRDLFVAAGLLEPRLGFHSYRRTLATTIAEMDDGGGIDIAGFILGHKKKGMTAKHYVVCRRLAAKLLERLPQPSG